MPDRLLPLLSDQPQTGDDLGARLGVGRVTVNTLAKKLLEDGVPLEITRAGYALAAGTPAPQLVPLRGEFGRAMRYAGTVGSTQDEIRRWADDPVQPAPHGAVWVAERQTSGRGRRGRAWGTAHGALAFSMLLRDHAGQVLTLAELALMPLAVGVALQEAAGAGGLKWPNDLLSPDRRKIAGILLDADLRGEEVRRAVLGIGVNVSSAPPGAACLHEFHPHYTRAQFLADTLAALERWLDAPADEMLNAWRERSLTLGQHVQIQAARGPLEGVAVDIDSHGSLLVQDARGTVHTVHAGDVQLVGAWSSGLS